ncbi:MAG: LytTR family DNA-binding domain-containing protein [Bacteroidota bacterium]
MSTSTLEQVSNPKPESLAFRKNGFLIGVLLILVLNTLNYHLAYKGVTWFSAYFFRTYFNDLGMGLAAWSLGFPMIRWAQRRYLTVSSLAIRFLVQLGLVGLTNLVIIILWTELTSEAINGHPVQPRFYSDVIPILILEVVIFMLLYLSFDRQVTAATPRQPFLELTYQQEQCLIPPSQILFFTVQDGVTRAYDGSEKFYLCRLPLQALEEQLAPEFFRLNRQYLIRKEAVSSYEKLENKKLAAKLDTGQQQRVVTVSRTNAPKFKQWLKA